MTNLANCPLCGCEPLPLFVQASTGFKYRIVCDNATCGGPLDDDYDTPQAAMDAWRDKVGEA